MAYNTKYVRATFSNKVRMVEYVRENKNERTSRWAIETKDGPLAPWIEVFNTDNSIDAANEFTSVCNKYR